MIIGKAIAEISKEDILELIANSVRENRSLDYKLTLPGTSNAEKKEFLKDISSLANSTGGYLVLGILEEAGVPKNAPGVEVLNEDALTLRLESMIRDGLDPRLSGIRIKCIPEFLNGYVVIIQVPQSWIAPHMITFDGNGRFYTRNNAGCHMMDVTELRSAFQSSGTISDFIRAFRDQRLSKIAVGDTPVLTRGVRPIVIHLSPIAAYAAGFSFSIEMLENLTIELRPLGVSGWNHQYNLDGFVTFSGEDHKGNDSVSYCQVFRTGQIESVFADVGLGDDSGNLYIPFQAFEFRIVEIIEHYMRGYAKLGIPCPIVGMISLVNMRDLPVKISERGFGGVHTGRPINRDPLLLPDFVLRSYDDNVPAALRPAFDMMWNAAGLPGSGNYDVNGIWIGRRW